MSRQLYCSKNVHWNWQIEYHSKGFVSKLYFEVPLLKLFLFEVYNDTVRRSIYYKIYVKQSIAPATY